MTRIFLAMALLCGMVVGGETKGRGGDEKDVKAQNASKAITALKAYGTAQVTFQVGKQGRARSNSGAGDTGYADNFRNLFYGNPMKSKDAVEESRNLMLISRSNADAFVIRDYKTPTVNIPTEPVAEPVPYHGYLFFEDQDVTDWSNTFAMFAVPASPEAGSVVLWMGLSGSVYGRDVRDDDYVEGMPRIDLEPPFAADGRGDLSAPWREVSRGDF